jgi:hypothetical protein
MQIKKYYILYVCIQYTSEFNFYFFVHNHVLFFEKRRYKIVNMAENLNDNAKIGINF